MNVSKLVMHAAPALAVALVLPLGAATAQAAGPGEGVIAGTWNHVLTIRNCATGDAITEVPTTSAYLPGGVVVELNPVPNPALRTPGLGIWKYAGGQKYELSLKYFRYNTDGSYAGKTLIDSDITYLRNDTLSQAAVVRIFNAADIQVATGCATLSSTRFTGDE